MVFAGEQTSARLIAERRTVSIAATHAYERVSALASLLHHLVTRRTRTVSVADGLAHVSAGKQFPAGENALRTTPRMAAVFLDVFVVTMRGFPAGLRTRWVKRAAEVLTRNLHGGSSALAANGDLQRTRRTFTRMTGQQTHVSPTGERLITDLSMSPPFQSHRRADRMMAVAAAATAAMATAVAQLLTLDVTLE